MNFMQEWIITKGAKAMFDKLWGFIDGRKAYIGGIASILTGFGSMANSYNDGAGFSKEAWNYILAGWTIIAGKSAINKIGGTK